MHALVLVLAGLASARREQNADYTLDKRQSSHFAPESRQLQTTSSTGALATFLLGFNQVPGWHGDASLAWNRVPGKVIQPGRELQASTVLRHTRHAAVKMQKKNFDTPWWIPDFKKLTEELGDFLFGMPEEAPMGLQRGVKDTDSELPDMFPATKTEFADLLESDEGEVKLIRPMLRQTVLEKKPLELVYDAEEDGWNAEAFHYGVDQQGPVVVIAKTQAGAIVGGYANCGFIGFGEPRNSISAFLFSWSDGDTSKPVVKLQKAATSFGEAATVDVSTNGPRFGYDGFSMMMTRGQEHSARSKLGLDYEAMPDRRNSIFAREEGNNAYITELRAYVGIFPEGKEVPYTTPQFAVR